MGYGYADSIKDQPVNSIDIDTVWSTIDKLKKQKEDLQKKKQDFNLAINTADITARTAGIGSVSGNYDTGAVNLNPGNVPLNPDQAIKKRELELMDGFLRSQGMGGQPAGGVSSGGVSPSSPSSPSPQAGSPTPSAPAGMGGLPPSVKSASLGGLNIDFDTPADVVTRGNGIRQELINNPIVKNYNDAHPLINAADEAMARIKQGDIKNYNAADQLLIVGLNKVLDPSVVREGEYARTPQGTSLINRLYGKYDQLSKGGSGLTMADREEILKGMKILLDNRGELYNGLLDQYGTLADKMGVPRDLVSTGYKRHTPLVGSGKKAPGNMAFDAEKEARYQAWKAKQVKS